VKRELIDVNVNLGRWPTRHVHGDEPRELIRILKSHDVTEAWTGSLDGLFHKDMASVNDRLAESCHEYGRRILQPIGSINPMLPGWEDDLRRCVEDHHMQGIRLHPNYHDYALAAPEFSHLLRMASEANLFVQIAVTMEDERMMHPRFRVPHVDTSSLADLLSDIPPVKIILLNAFRAVRGEVLVRLLENNEVLFDIAWIEGIAGIRRMLQTVPVERLLFGSHAPLFYYESALLKLEESALSEDEWSAIVFGNARQLPSTG